MGEKVTVTTNLDFGPFTIQPPCQAMLSFGSLHLQCQHDAGHYPQTRHEFSIWWTESDGGT